MLAGEGHCDEEKAFLSPSVASMEPCPPTALAIAFAGVVVYGGKSFFADFKRGSPIHLGNKSLCRPLSGSGAAIPHSHVHYGSVGNQSLRVAGTRYLIVRQEIQDQMIDRCT